MMLPPPCRFITGAAYFMPRKTDPICRSIAAEKSA